MPQTLLAGLADLRAHSVPRRLLTRGSEALRQLGSLSALAAYQIKGGTKEKRKINGWLIVEARGEIFQSHRYDATQSRSTKVKLCCAMTRFVLQLA